VTDRLDGKMIYIRLLICLVILMPAFGSFNFSKAAANAVFSSNQDEGWSDPINLSPTTTNAWFPDVAVDSTGQIHVVWAGGTVGYDSVLYTSSPNGKEWSELNDIRVIAQKAIIYADATRPALLVDQSGYLDMSYGTSDTYFSRSTIFSAGSAKSWEEPVKINNKNTSYFSKAIEDTHGILHMFFTENQPGNSCVICYHLFHRTSNDQGKTWSDPLDISKENTGTAKPQIITTSEGNFFVVWEAGIGGALGSVQDPSAISFAASYDGGKTWTFPQRLSPKSLKNSKNVAIGMTSQDQIVVAWLSTEDNTVNYQISSNLGKNWSSPYPIPDIWGGWDVYATKLDDYSMAVDSKGTLHLVLVGKMEKDETTLGVLHLTWNGFSWSEPEEIIHLNGDVPEWPRIAIGQGNVLNVVWFVRDEENIWNTEGGHYRIMYSRKTISAPSTPTVLPVFLPTPSATPSEETVRSIITQPNIKEPQPTFAPAEKPQSFLVYKENDYLLVAAIAIAPVFLLILIVSYLKLRKPF
jgi:hypothetical protein